MKSEFLMALGAVLILLFAAGCTGSSGPQSTGRAVFTVTDAAADMGAVTSVKVTVDSLQVQSAAKGWITVASTPQTYDLLQLKASGMQSLLADANLENGTYGQVRMIISKVIVTDSSGDHVAKLPSGELKIVGGFTVLPNSTVAVTFDFLADQSLHVTGNGTYILAPVVRMQERAGAQVDTSSRENVRINGGRTGTDTEVGMDEDGNVGEGKRIAPGLNLTIREDGRIVGTPSPNAAGNGNSDASGNGKGRVVVGITDVAADMSTVSSIMVTVDSVQVHSSGGDWVTLNSAAQTYDLLVLNATATNALLADANISSGAYDQIWLDISKVTVTDVNGTHEAKLPSGTLRFMLNTQVAAGQTSALILDFSARDSLHQTGNGLYILAPVIVIESRDNAEVDGRDHANVRVTGGSVRDHKTVGMDIDGNVDVDRRIPADASVSIGSDNVIRIHVRDNRTWDGANPIIGGDTSPGNGTTPPARAASYCSGKNGPQLVNCTAGVAIEAKDVSICTELADQEALNTCITTWCAALRDFNSCYRIADNDDRLMCLSRCNPNRNQ